MVLIWETSIMTTWGVVALKRVVQNMRIWATRELKPKILYYLGRWKSEHLGQFSVTSSVSERSAQVLETPKKRTKKQSKKLSKNGSKQKVKPIKQVFEKTDLVTSITSLTLKERSTIVETVELSDGDRSETNFEDGIDGTTLRDDEEEEEQDSACDYAPDESEGTYAEESDDRSSDDTDEDGHTDATNNHEGIEPSREEQSEIGGSDQDTNDSESETEDECNRSEVGYASSTNDSEDVLQSDSKDDLSPTMRKHCRILGANYRLFTPRVSNDDARSLGAAYRLSASPNPCGPSHRRFRMKPSCHSSP
jgi:hypothetical protein